MGFVTAQEKYKSALNFRMALQDKLLHISKTKNADIQALYRQTACSQFLDRVFQNNDQQLWALKGGLALELRYQLSRATKDIDLAFKDIAVARGSFEKKSERIYEELIRISKIDLGDFFDFKVSPLSSEIENPPHGGVRLSVSSFVNGKVFSKFSIDVAFGDIWLEPQSRIKLTNNCSDLGLSPQTALVVNIEQHLAEKYFAYLTPRDTPNSRVKDLVDIYLILKQENINRRNFQTAFETLCEKRFDVPRPIGLPEPPAFWENKFAAMASSLGLVSDINEAYKTAANFYSEIVP